MEQNKIEIVSAKNILANKYQNLYLHTNFENKLDIIRCIFLYFKSDISDHIFQFKNYADIFDEDYITLNAFKHFDSRINEFSQIFNNHKQLCEKNTEKDLIRLGDYKDIDPLHYLTIIKKLENLYVDIPRNINGNKINVSINNYCLYFGDWQYQKNSNYSYFSDKFQNTFKRNYPKSLGGYNSPFVNININTIQNGYLSKIDHTCFDQSLREITISKILITNNDEIFIDSINGGVLTSLPIIADFYGYLNTEVNIFIENLYVNKFELIYAYEVMSADTKDPTEKMNKDQQREHLICLALNNGDLSKYVNKNIDNTYISKITKVEFFMVLSNIHRNSRNKSLFAINPDDFFKKSKNMKNILSFKAGRPRKN